MANIIEFFKKMFLPNPTLGARHNLPDNRDIQLSSLQQYDSLIPNYKTDISVIPVQDQKRNPSCVGQAEGTIIAFYDYRENKNISASRRYIFAKCKELDGTFGGGTYPRIGASIIKNKGVPSAEIVPDNNDLSYDEYATVLDSEAILEDAKKRKATYAFPEIDSYSLKQAILTNKLVSVSLMVDWKAFKKNGELTKPDINNSSGLHRVVLYGYDVNDNFYFRNSWGKNWGKDGNGVFKWEDYKNFIYDPICYVDLPNEVLKEASKKDYIFTRPLKIGSMGSDVTELQKRLKKFGYFILPYFTEYYGPATASALKKYQISVGLSADGSFGPKTMSKMNGVKMTLEEAIIQVESQGNLYAVGDKNLKDHAYGCMQIRKPCVDDVNKNLGTNYKAEDCLGKKDLSLLIFREYQKIYNPNGSDEEKARTWNGGPGWRRKPSLTDPYWSKVKRLLN